MNYFSLFHFVTGDRLKIQSIAIIGKTRPKKAHKPVDRFFFSACKAQTIGPMTLKAMKIKLRTSIFI
jgi:hypothetical protein